MSVTFKKLKINEWQQFQSIDVDFHERLTILTGANGSGKTTILSKLLAVHFGWGAQSLSTPKKEKKTGRFSFFTRLYNGEVRDQNNDNIIGELCYSDGAAAKLIVPNQGSNNPQYQIQIQGQQGVQCFFIPSHRSVFRYQPISNIPFQKKNTQAAFNEVSNSEKQRYAGNRGDATSFHMKNTLLGWAINGYGVNNNAGKEIMLGDEEQIEHFEGFKDVLKEILPKTLGFDDFEIREREIVFVCNQGRDEFILEQASGGISAIIDFAWQIYMYSVGKDSFTVIIDEVENHLHPILQRQILPDLLKAFPAACFVVSTHSPLVIGSVQDSNIYVLQYNDNGKIISQKLDLKKKAKTATEILDDVLGVSFTMPAWAEERLEEIIKKYLTKDMTGAEFEQMREELRSGGLESLMPEAISSIVENKNDQN
ncbi:MAG: AAA family ATPase [SAR324 cluster bacterium]|nr:AAA family ATPase [SAR324 cluster bacterium]